VAALKTTVNSGYKGKLTYTSQDNKKYSWFAAKKNWPSFVCWGRRGVEK